VCNRCPDPNLNRTKKTHYANSLQTLLIDQRGEKGLTTRYASAFVDLDGDNQPEVIVYIVGETWCGSGGCRMIVLKAKGSSYEVMSATSVTRLPIRVLDGESHGWHNISVWVQGGGIQPGYEAELSFNGQSYPRILQCLLLDAYARKFQEKKSYLQRRKQRRCTEN